MIEDINECQVAYNLDNYKTLAEISNKILEIDLKKKTVLEEFKDSDKILPEEVYNSMVQRINNLYDSFVKPLEIRRQKILSEIISGEENARMLHEISVIKQIEIKVGFRFKSLAYENRLFAKRCKAAHRVLKAALRERYRVPMPSKKIVLPANKLANKFIITGPVPP